MVSSRIIIVCGAGYVSGKEIMALELGRGLAAHGTTPYIIVSHWNNGDFIGRLQAANLPYETLPIGFISATLTRECIRMTAEQMIRWPGLAIGYARMLRSKKPQCVVHTNWHHLILLWPWLKSTRDVFWLHETLPNTPRYRRMLGRLAKRLGRIICVSNAVARAAANLGIAAEKIVVVHNGVEAPWSIEPRAARQGNEFHLGIVGQVGEWKGHGDLIKAFAIAVQHDPRLRLHVYGTGSPEYITTLKDELESQKLGDRVKWHGFEADRGKIFGQLDVGVVPSRFDEPFGLAALEPAFFGLPVIASARGALPEIVLDNVTGLIVPGESPVKLANAILRLAGDSKMRNQLGEAARQRAVELFSREKFVADFTETLRDLRELAPKTGAAHAEIEASPSPNVQVEATRP